MKSITKKLKNEIFIWDPNAYQGKGYWFVLGTKGGMGRAASANEFKKLGKPDKKEIDPVSPKVAEPDKKVKLPKKAAKKRPDWAYGRRREAGEESRFAEAEAMKERSFGSLAAERMLSGQGVLGSFRGAASDKLGAMGTRMRGKFTAASIGKMLGGSLGSVALGKLFKNKQEDIEHFSGVSGKGGTASATASKITPVPTMSSEESQLGDSHSILAKIYKLMLEQYEYNKKKDEITSAKDALSKEVHERDKIDFLKNDKDKEGKDDKKKKGLFEKLADFLVVLEMGVKGLFKRLLGSLGSLIGGGAKFLGKGLGLAGAGLAAAGGALGGLFGKRTAKPVPQMEVPTTANKGLQTAEKAGAELAKDAGTATKAAGGTSKLAQGGAKLLGFLKSVPGLAVIGAGADLIMRVSDINSKLETGEIKDAEYKKEITKAIGGAAAAGLLPILGASLGSIIGPIGTITGGLVGAGAAVFGGDKIGEYVAEKTYDYFVEGKTGSAIPSEMTVDPMGNIVPSATPVPQSNATAVPQQQSAIPTELPQSTLGPRLNTAVAQNNSLDDKTGTQQMSTPVIINKTNNITNNGGGGGSGGKASLRNDDAVLQKMQYGTMRTV
jgi:hypothetical protein